MPGLLLAAGLLVAVGIIDDRWGMGAISKLAAQVAAGGILVWSQVVLSWVPEPGGGVFVLPPQLGLVLTILIVVVTINAVNFIDGLDGLAAGVVAIAASAFLVYSYVLARVVGIHSQSVPTLIAALLAGICLGFLPHNFNPARIFMGDTGSMLIGLLLAYVPLSSTATLDPNVLIHYNVAAVNRFPTILPLLIPVAILIIPYADLLLAVVRRTRAGMSPFDADKKHLHHRLLSVGHSHRQSVLIMYLWVALFTGVVTSLSLIRTSLIVLVGFTVVAVLALLPVTMPRLRPTHWRQAGRRARPAPNPAARTTPSAPPAWPAPSVPAAPSDSAAQPAWPASAAQPAPSLGPPAQAPGRQSRRPARRLDPRRPSRLSAPGRPLSPDSPDSPGNLRSPRPPRAAPPPPPPALTPRG